MWISSGVRILSRLCDQLWRASDGWQEDPQCGQLASTYHSERASAFLWVCQLLPEIHPKFQHGSSPADFYDKEGESTPHLVSCSPSGFSNTQRTIHHRAILHNPDPEQEFIVEVDASSTGIGQFFPNVRAPLTLCCRRLRQRSIQLCFSTSPLRHLLKPQS